MWKGIRARILSTSKVCVGPLWRKTGVTGYRGKAQPGTACKSAIVPRASLFNGVSVWTGEGQAPVDPRVGSRKRAVTALRQGSLRM